MSKTNRRLGLLRKIKHFVPLHTRLTLFHPLILPLYDYNNIIWGDKNNTKLMSDPELENWKLRTNESSRTCLFFVPGFAPRLRQTFLATNIIANQCFIVNAKDNFI